MMNEERMKELLKSLIGFAKRQMGNDYNAVFLLRLCIGFSMAELRELGETFPNFYQYLEKAREEYSNVEADMIKKLYEE